MKDADVVYTTQGFVRDSKTEVKQKTHCYGAGYWRFCVFGTLYALFNFNAWVQRCDRWVRLKVRCYAIARLGLEVGGMRW